MKLVLSYACAIISSSLLLQMCWVIGHPSTFGRFADLPVIVLYANFPVALLFATVVPVLWCLRRSSKRLTWPWAAVCGAALGVAVKLVFLAAIRWPIRLPELVSAATGGAVGIGVYARLQQPSVKPAN